MTHQAQKIIRASYKDGLFMVRLKLKKADGTYLQASSVTSIVGQVLQDVQYSGESDWTDMKDAGGTTINNNIQIPTSAILATPVACMNDDGASDYYNFVYTFGPNIFPLFGRSNMIIIRFNLTDGKYFYAPRIVCRVI